MAQHLVASAFAIFSRWSEPALEDVIEEPPAVEAEDEAEQPGVEVDSVALRCVAAHADSQIAQSDGDLLRSRELLRVCSSPICPELVRRDCTVWRAEVERALPSVSVRVELDGAVVTPAAVFLDALDITGALAEPIVVNPGVHAFAAELLVDGELERSESQVVVQPSLRRQVVLLSFRSKASLAAASGTGQAGDARPSFPFDPESGPRLRSAGIGLLTAGVALAVGAAVLGGIGIYEHQDADDPDGCRPFCSDRRVARVESLLISADVLGATAAASIVTGIVLTAVGRHRIRVVKKRKVSASVGFGALTIRY